MNRPTPSAHGTSYRETVDWRDRGLCNDHDPELWFPDGKSRQFRRRTEKAKGICAECPVRRTCRAAGTHEKWGVWGGIDEWERAGVTA